MTSTFAQIFNPGASNSSDFQPPTQNPQDIGSQGLQQQGQTNVINPQEALNTQRDTTLQVPSNGQPLPENQSITSAQPDYLGLIILVLLVTVLIGFVLWLRRNKVSSITTEQEIDTPIPTSLQSQQLPTEAKSSEKVATGKLTKKAKRRKKHAKRKK